MECEQTLTTLNLENLEFFNLQVQSLGRAVSLFTFDLTIDELIAIYINVTRGASAVSTPSGHGSNCNNLRTDHLHTRRHSCVLVTGHICSSSDTFPNTISTIIQARFCLVLSPKMKSIFAHTYTITLSHALHSPLVTEMPFSSQHAAVNYWISNRIPS